MWLSFPRISKLFLQILVSWRVWFPMHQTHSCVTKIILKVVLPCWLSVYKVNKLWLHLFLCSYLKESHEPLQTHKIQVPMLIKSFEGGELRVCRAQRLICWLLNSRTSYWVFFSDQRCSVPSLNRQVPKRKNELIYDLSINSMPCSPTSPARILCFQFLLNTLKSFTWKFFPWTVPWDHGIPLPHFITVALSCTTNSLCLRAQC